MRVTKMLVLILVLGLLYGARLINESLIVLRATELAQEYSKTPSAKVGGGDASLGEAFLLLGLVVATAVEPTTLNGVVREATFTLIFGCILIVGATLGLGLLLRAHIKSGKNSALEGARRRRRSNL